MLSNWLGFAIFVSNCAMLACIPRRHAVESEFSWAVLVPRGSGWISFVSGPLYEMIFMTDSHDERHAQTYPDGRLYRPAVGNFAPRETLQDHLAPTHSVVSGKVRTSDFLEIIKRELRIQFYQPNTINNYVIALTGF